MGAGKLGWRLSVAVGSARLIRPLCSTRRFALNYDTLRNVLFPGPPRADVLTRAPGGANAVIFALLAIVCGDFPCRSSSDLLIRVGAPLRP